MIGMVKNLEFLKPWDEQLIKLIDLLLKNPLHKPFLRFYQRFLCQNFNETNANKIINLFQSIAVSDFDLLIATGGNTAYISASLGIKHNIKVIQIGSVKGIDLKNYFAHITVEPKDKSPNNIVTVLAPTSYKPIDLFKNQWLWLNCGQPISVKR